MAAGQRKAVIRTLENYNAPLACMASTLSAVSAGYAIGFSSPAIQELRGEKGPLHLSSEQATWFGSLLPLAAMFGSLLSGPLMDFTGRRITILVVIFCFLVSWITMFSAFSLAMLFVGRILSGLATGMCTAVIPVYISEVSPAKLRGKMGTLFSVLLCLGIPAAYTSSVFYEWRAMAEIGAVIGSATFLVCFLLPESPYWLLSKNRSADAFDVLRKIRGPDSDVAAEVKEIEHLQSELHERVTINDVTRSSFVKPVAIGVMLMVFQQFSGVNAIFFYAHDIFHRANFHDNNMASILASMVQVVVSFLATFTVEKAGRRKLLLFSAAGMLVCHAILGACMYSMTGSQGDPDVHREIQLAVSPPLQDFRENDTKRVILNVTGQYDTPGIANDLPITASSAPTMHSASFSGLEKEETKLSTVTATFALASIILYIAFYSFGFGPIPYIVLSEMLPQRARGAAGGVGTMSNWLCAFLITKTFLNLVDLLSAAGVFWLFSSFCFLAMLFVWRCVPETRGKTLAEIRDIFLSETEIEENATRGRNRKIVVKSPQGFVNKVANGHRATTPDDGLKIADEQTKSLIYES